MQGPSSKRWKWNRLLSDLNRKRYLSVGLLEISEYINPEEFEILEDGLNAHAAQAGAPAYEETELSIIQRDDDDKIVAGLTGTSVWNWLYIDIIWVDEALRGKGVGAELLRAAEDEAKARDCHSLWVWTESFQASGFYEKQGYKKFVDMPDFPVGHQRIGFMKHLNA